MQCKVPSYIQLDYQQIMVNTNSSFVLQSRTTGITLKGQMLPTTVQLPGASGMMDYVLFHHLYYYLSQLLFLKIIIITFMALKKIKKALVC